MLQTLATKYKELSEQEMELERLLNRLKEEEEALIRAISQVETVPAASLQPQHRQAIQRLEEALMQEFSSDSSSSSDEGSDD